MKINIQTRAIASATGWVANFDGEKRPLIAWALNDERNIVGLVIGAGGDARNAEEEPRFKEYVFTGRTAPSM